MSYPGCYANSSPAAKPSLLKGIASLLVLADLILAEKHQSTCASCQGKSIWVIALNLRHLVGS